MTTTQTQENHQDQTPRTLPPAWTAERAIEASEEAVLNVGSIKTREQWLVAFGRMIMPILIGAAGRDIPAWRISVGFPLGQRSKAQGQSFGVRASHDGHAEIFVHPGLSDPMAVAHIMVQQLLLVADPETGYGRAFQSRARGLGFVAPFDVPTPTPDTRAWIGMVLSAMPPYPHAQLDAEGAIAKRKAQKSRYHKSTCGACGYTVRVARRWVVEVGPPCCPVHGEMSVELPDDEGDGEEGHGEQH